jgi:hypothetical protein
MGSQRRSIGRSLRLGAFIAVASLAMLVPTGFAQTPVGEATPVGDMMGMEAPHPAHIHTGTCDTLGDVLVPLTDVADAASMGERSGPESAHHAKMSYTVVDLPLRDIIDGGHAINVHQSADAIDVYIACGDIGGVVTTDEDGAEELIVVLGELNDSGHVGVAWLGAKGGQTEVAVFLIEPEELQ